MDSLGPVGNILVSCQSQASLAHSPIDFIHVHKVGVYLYTAVCCRWGVCTPCGILNTCVSSLNVCVCIVSGCTHVECCCVWMYAMCRMWVDSLNTEEFRMTGEKQLNKRRIIKKMCVCEEGDEGEKGVRGWVCICSI